MAGTMKFSEVPPYPYTCRSLHRVRTGKMRDFPVVRCKRTVQLQAGEPFGGLAKPTLHCVIDQCPPLVSGDRKPAVTWYVVQILNPEPVDRRTEQITHRCDPEERPRRVSVRPARPPKGRQRSKSDSASISAEIWPMGMKVVDNKFVMVSFALLSLKMRVVRRQVWVAMRQIVLHISGPEP